MYQLNFSINRKTWLYAGIITMMFAVFSIVCRLMFRNGDDSLFALYWLGSGEGLIRQRNVFVLLLFFLVSMSALVAGLPITAWVNAMMSTCGAVLVSLFEKIACDNRIQAFEAGYVHTTSARFEAYYNGSAESWIFMVIASAVLAIVLDLVWIKRKEKTVRAA